MATKRQLTERWREPGGRERAERLLDAMEHGAQGQELGEILRGLPYSDDVAPSLDLRGLQFRLAMTLSGLDLSGVRLDGAKLIGNIRDCICIGAVFDDIDARNATMKGDFTRASFQRARLNGCYFDGSVLRAADFTRAKLEQASLRGCDCTGARFIDARVRFSTLIDTVLVNADLSGGDFTESSLTRARFDDSTRLQDAQFAGARLDDQLARFASGQGVQQGPELHGFALAHLEASATILRSRNHDGHLDALMARIAELRATVAKEPDFDWTAIIDDEFPDDIVEEVVVAVGEADVSD